MDSGYFIHILPMILASAICTPMIGFGLFYRRKDNSRRWLLVGGGIFCSALTIFTITVNSGGGSDARQAAVGIIFGAGLLFPAVSMLWLGKRGRRVGDHPMCRRCGFDLFRKPPESTRCGECGADLQLPKAIVIGIRKLRIGWLLCGIFTFCLGLMVASAPAYQYIRTIDFYRFKPTRLVLDDLKSKATQQQAIQLIYDQLKDPNISESQARMIAEYALNNSSNQPTWTLRWTLIDAIAHRDILDEATSRRLMREVGNIEFLHVPPVLVLGRPILVYSRILPSSAKSQSAFALASAGGHLGAEVTAESVVVGEVPILLAAEKLVDDPNRGQVISLDPAAGWAKLSAGSVAIKRNVTLKMTLLYKGKQLIETVSCSKTGTSMLVTLQSATPPLAQPTPADQANVWTATFKANETPLALHINCTTSNSARIFARVSFIAAQGRSDVGTVEFASCQLDAQLFSTSPLKIPSGDFQIELTPSPVDAADGMDMTPVLNQTIRISRVKREGDSNGS